MAKIYRRSSYPSRPTVGSTPEWWCALWMLVNRIIINLVQSGTKILVYRLFFFRTEGAANANSNCQQQLMPSGTTESHEQTHGSSQFRFKNFQYLLTSSHSWNSADFFAFTSETTIFFKFNCWTPVMILSMQPGIFVMAGARDRRLPTPTS